MKIGSICTRRVATIDSANTPIQAAALMREHHVGTLVVTTETTEGPRVSGIVTDRDLVIDALADGVDGISGEIGALTSRQVASVSEDDDVASAIAVMQDNRVRRLLVINAEQRLVGIVSLDDLVEACASQMDGLVKAIRGGIEKEVLDTLTAPTVPLLLRMPVMGAAA
jgi:CBS domain-containing protein